MLQLHTAAPLRARMQFQSRHQIDLTLIGEVVVATVPTLAPLSDLVAQLEPSAVTIRLSRVAAVDVAGWRALEHLSERLEHAGIDVTVASTSAEPTIPFPSQPLPSRPVQPKGQPDLVVQKSRRRPTRQSRSSCRPPDEALGTGAPTPQEVPRPQGAAP